MKFCNFVFQPTGESWILIVGHGKSLKIMCVEKNRKESILLGTKK